MATCNTAQNEVGGKDLLLKKCKEFTAISTTNASADIEITGHGAKVGDIVKFTAVGANTIINVDDFFIVHTVVDVDTIRVKATLTGAALIMNATSAVVEALVFRNLGGLRSKEFALSSEAVDITNVSSDEWSSMLDGAGVRSASMSGSGVWTNEPVFQEFFQDFLNNRLTCLALIDAKAGRVYEGCFKITELSVSGDYDAEGQYSVSAESSGPVTVFNFA
jgi:predicted secreted protein